MKNANTGTYIFKGVSLLILNIITFLLVFSIWAIINIPLFPWALMAITFSLIMVNVTVFATQAGIKFFGPVAYIPVLVSTVFYYIFIMIFTGAMYITISPKWYVIATLIATLVYIVTIFGLRIAGTHNIQDTARQEIQQAKVLDINLQLMLLNDSIKKSSNYVEKETYDEIIQAFNNMSERLKASTPFGRINKPVVVNLESEIALKFSKAKDDTLLLKTTDSNEQICHSLTEDLNDIKSLVVNREQLIVQ